jgi:hypothetical protein
MNTTLMGEIMKVYTRKAWNELSIGYRMYVRVNFLRRMVIRERKLAKVYNLADYRSKND